MLRVLLKATEARSSLKVRGKRMLLPKSKMMKVLRIWKAPPKVTAVKSSLKDKESRMPLLRKTTKILMTKVP